MTSRNVIFGSAKKPTPCDCDKSKTRARRRCTLIFLTITPGSLRDDPTYNDHRTAEPGAVGLRVPGILIDNPACVAKTYPRFFEDLERLR